MSKKRKNNISGSYCIEITGPLAMFTTPISKENCEHISYPYPTYGAVKGMLDKIYYRRGMIWVPEKCRIMKEICYDTRIRTTPCYHMVQNDTQRYCYCYLKDVKYQILAHYEKDFRFADLNTANLRHDAGIRREITLGRTTVYLGTSDCMGIAMPAEWGAGEGYYDGQGRGDDVFMYHHFDYTAREGGRIKNVYYTCAHMYDGVLDFTDMPLSGRRWRDDAG